MIPAPCEYGFHRAPARIGGGGGICFPFRRYARIAFLAGCCSQGLCDCRRKDRRYLRKAPARCKCLAGVCCMNGFSLIHFSLSGTRRRSACRPPRSPAHSGGKRSQRRTRPDTGSARPAIGRGIRLLSLNGLPRREEPIGSPYGTVPPHRRLCGISGFLNPSSPVQIRRLLMAMTSSTGVFLPSATHCLYSSTIVNWT